MSRDGERLVRAWVAAGSNLEPFANLRCGLERLRGRFPDLVHSALYANAPREGGGPEYVNLAAGFTTALDPLELRRVLREIESACGRNREAGAAAGCALDIDLVLYGDRVGRFDGLELPRGELLTRAYVLGPLAELAPDLVHPVAGRRLAALWEEFDRGAHPLRRLEGAGE